MARSRNIKPGFFLNDTLGELPVEARLLFIGLWTLADREGRLADRPKKIKIQVFPYDEFDVDDLLSKLQLAEFIRRYQTDGVCYIEIVNWHKHQNPHHKEVGSEIPPPTNGENRYSSHYKPVTGVMREEILKRDGYKCVQCGATENLHIDHINPITNKGISERNNLQTLCAKCNTSKKDSIITQPQTKHEPSMGQARPNENAPYPTDSLNLIPLTLNPSTTLSGKPDVKPDYKKTAKQILTFLNDKTGRHYKPVPANVDMIAARLKEGATTEECHYIIAKKAREWSGDEKMNQYLRPATLFNRTKFAQYQGEISELS